MGPRSRAGLLAGVPGGLFGQRFRRASPSLPSDYDPQGSANASPIDPLALPNSGRAASDARALAQRHRLGAASDWYPKRSFAAIARGPRVGRGGLPSVGKNP